MHTYIFYDKESKQREIVLLFSDAALSNTGIAKWKFYQCR